ncbi:MAG: tripartite tricarboxylate transporter family receptor, partial [Hyphomicrobiales bacterium]|nr:tripartite tricarboxylate transporter family receptor [Hyphomicrobiales bacterium]
VIPDPDNRKVVELLVSGTRLGRPLATTPGVPEERVKALRDAFDAVMKDPDFLKEAANSNIDVDPVRGVDMQEFVKKVLATPKHLAARARELLE